jgi:hypothetical protein
MYKRLRIYYLYVALPFVLLLLGAAVYFDAIKKTIVSNPHPQINYAIFVIILLGGVLIIRSVFRLMHEAKALSEFSAAVRDGTDLATLQSMAINYDGDIAYVLRMIAASGGRSITHQEQAAIEHELEKASSRLYGRNALPQFLSGLLVGMGLLGTFIGLLSTLNDISALIGSFADIDMGKANPIDVFRNMIERMKAPMQSMGIAFSASLFGLLGSIILGLMMVGIRRCLGDILSLLGSEVAQHIEFALAHEGFAYSKTALKQGLGQLRPGAGVTAADVIARPKGPADGSPVLPSAAAPATTTGASVAEGMPPGQLIAMDVAAGQETDDRQRARGRMELAGDEGEGVRVLLRIEDRLAESARLQLRALTGELDDFNKQRGDMLRALAENTEASTNFRGELQRVGRQLGTILGLMEKGNGELMAQLSELMVRTGDESAETRKLMNIQIDQQRRLNEILAENTRK